MASATALFISPSLLYIFLGLFTQRYKIMRHKKIRTNNRAALEHSHQRVIPKDWKNKSILHLVRKNTLMYIVHAFWRTENLMSVFQYESLLPLTVAYMTVESYISRRSSTVGIEERCFPLSNFVLLTYSTVQTPGWNRQAYTPAPYPAQCSEVLLRYLGKGENLPCWGYSDLCHKATPNGWI